MRQNDFGADLLVDEDREQQPEGHREGDVEGGEEEQVGVGDAPAPVGPER